MKPPDNAEVFETDLLTCWFEENGILFSVSKKAERTVEAYDLLFDLYHKLTNNGTKKICTLGNITETEPLPKEVRVYVSEQTTKYIKAMALISDSTMGKAAGNIFEVLSQTPYPVAMFDNKDDAVKWLKKYL